MKASVYHLFSILLIAASVSCQTLPRPVLARGTVTHVVVCWLKHPGDSTARARLIEISKTFRAIPGVIDVCAGRVLPSARPPVDSTFDIALVITFVDRDALQGYVDHPIHQKAVRESIKPLVKRFVVYDFTNE